LAETDGLLGITAFKDFARDSCVVTPEKRKQHSSNNLHNQFVTFTEPFGKRVSELEVLRF